MNEKLHSFNELERLGFTRVNIFPLTINTGFPKGTLNLPRDIVGSWFLEVEER